MSNIDIEKKEKEKIILNNLFGAYGFKVEDNEPLDFILSKDNHCFGVEVTRLYYNQGFARLKNKPNYAMDVQNNVNIHKDDYNNLKIKSLYIKCPTDEKYHFLINEINHERPTNEEFANMIIERINDKNTRAEEYKNDKTEWLELLINDEENYFNEDYSLEQQQMDRILKVVDNSIFRTVYILSKHKGVSALAVIGIIPEFLEVDIESI